MHHNPGHSNLNDTNVHTPIAGLHLEMLHIEQEELVI